MKATPEEIAHYEKLAVERGGQIHFLGGVAFVAPVKISEKNFQQAVIDEAKKNGWRVYHTYDSRKSTAGWPDLVCIRGRIMIVAELKVPPNKTTAAQEDWLDAFRQLAEGCDRIEVFLWNPADWPEIEETLRRLV